MRQGPEGAVLLSKGRLASGGNPSPHRLLVRGAGVEVLCVLMEVFHDVAILSCVSRLRRYCAVISSCTGFQEALFCPLLVPSSLLLVGRGLPACMISGWSKRVCAYSRRESSHARHKPSTSSYNDLSRGDRRILRGSALSQERKDELLGRDRSVRVLLMNDNRSVR